LLLTPFNFQDKASKSSSAYEAVFGLKYHHDLPGSLEVEDLRGIKTVEEYLKVFPDSNMQRLANQFCLDGDVEDVMPMEKRMEQTNQKMVTKINRFLKMTVPRIPSLKMTQSLRTLTSPYLTG
jgi:CBS-domain-containing membrane protein